MINKHKNIKKKLMRNDKNNNTNYKVIKNENHLSLELNDFKRMNGIDITGVMSNEEKNWMNLSDGWRGINY